MSAKSVSAKLNLHISGAFSLPVSDSPLHQCPTPPPNPHTSPSFMCPKHIPFQPLHSPTSSFTCSQIYFSLSLYPGQPSSLPPSRLSLRAQWQSHHTLSIRLVRPGRSAAQHHTVLVWSHQCQSVSLTLSVTLKRFRLPDIVCFHPPSCPIAGQETGKDWDGSQDSA